MMLRRIAADFLFLRGNELLESGQTRRALTYLSLAARMARSSPQLFGAAALAASRAGERDTAQRWCERAIELEPAFLPAHDLIETLYLHGENFLQLLGRFHRHLRPRTYVEIGVETGASIVLAQPGTLALGVDPEPKITRPLPENVRIFAQPSDDFFQRDVRAELGGLPVELALIDGMHHFEFALRDFMNLERLSTPESTILIDDVFPHDRTTARRERTTAFWSGDVWRVVVLLKKHRPDLQVHVVASPPTGLAVVRNLDPSSRVIADNLERLCAEFMALDYSYLDQDRAAKLSLFPNDWEKIAALLGSARQL